MRKSLRVLAAMPWLLVATACLTDGSSRVPPPTESTPPSNGASIQPSDKAEVSINYVEIIQLDPKTEVFTAQLVDVHHEKILLEISGKGTQLKDFQEQSAKIAPRPVTITFTGPGAGTSDIIVKPPHPPGPPGQELIKLAQQMAHSYESFLQLTAPIQPSVPPSPTHQNAP